MSDLRVTNLKGRNAGEAPTLPDGVVITGIATVSSVIVGTGVTLSSSGINVTGVITASSFSGNGSGLTGVAATTLTIGAGTTALPSISPTGDTNTGIFFPAADTIAASTGGAERVRITAAGLMGVGTLTPSVPLHVEASSGEAFRAAATGANQSIWSSYKGGSPNVADLRLGVDSAAGGSYGVGGGAVVWNAGNSALAFGTNNTERARFDASGSLLVGTSTATIVAAALGAKFQLSQSSNVAIDYVGNTAATGHVYCQYLHFSGQSPNSIYSAFLMCYDTTTQRFAVRGDGGIANYSANNANLSDINAKKDIAPAADTWDCVKEWEIVNYRYKDQPDDANLNLGVIAQQVAESCPELITIFSAAQESKLAVLDEEGNEVDPAQEAQPEKLGVKEQQVHWMAIKALQEAMGRIEQLETSNTDLLARVIALETA